MLRDDSAKSCSVDARWLTVIVILLTVFLFNLSYIFIDGLWPDDARHYFRYTEGTNLLDYEYSGMIGFLNPLRVKFFGYAMVEWGLPVIRGIYVCIMAMCSVLLFYLYKNVFGVDVKVALPASVIPNILPSLEGIPFGLINSYAMWSLAPILLSMLLLKKAFVSRGIISLLIMAGALLCYVAGLNLSPSGMFLIPSVLLLCLMFFPEQRLRSLFYGIFFFVYGLWILFIFYQQGYRQPVSIPSGKIIERVKIFFEMAGFMPFNQPYAIYIIVLFSVIGLLGLLAFSPKVYRQPVHFNYSDRVYRFMMICWPLCWIVANGVAYTATSSTFRAVDYAYIFNYGVVFLQTVGLFLLVTFVAERILSNDKSVHIVVSLVLISVVLFCGFQRIHYKDQPFTARNDIPTYEWRSSMVREQLSSVSIPEGAQLLFLDVGDQDHPLSLATHSGNIRYALKRNDIYALYGTDRYPNNVFAPSPTETKSRFSLTGFNKERPVMAFRYRDSLLEPVCMLLQVIPVRHDEKSLLQWSLYDLRNTEEPPLILAQGNGMATYTDYLRNELPADLRTVDIAFSPQRKLHDIVDRDYVDKMGHCENLIEDPVNFANWFTLLAAFAMENDDFFSMQLLLQYDKRPDRPFFGLGYRLNPRSGGDERYEWLGIWEYAEVGDYIAINIPLERGELTEGVILRLTHRWRTGAHRPLPVYGGTNNEKSFVIIRQLQ